MYHRVPTKHTWEETLPKRQVCALVLGTSRKLPAVTQMVSLECIWKPRVRWNFCFGNLGFAEVIKEDQKFTCTPYPKSFGDVRLFINFSSAFSGENSPKLFGRHFALLLIPIVTDFLSSQGHNFKVLFFSDSFVVPTMFLVLFLATSSPLSLQLEFLELPQQPIRQNYFHLAIIH